MRDKTGMKHSAFCQLVQKKFTCPPHGNNFNDDKTYVIAIPGPTLEKLELTLQRFSIAKDSSKPPLNHTTDKVLILCNF